MDVIWSVLPFLALLACPLMMLFCVFGMGRMGRRAGTHDAAIAGTPEERLVQIQRELAAVRMELAMRQEGAAPAASQDAADTPDRPLDAAPAPAHAARRLA